jgi:hypothetical protein
MTETIEGVYRNGKVELSRQPKDAENARVLVTFVRDEDGAARSRVQVDPATGVSIPLPPGPERDAAIENLLVAMKRGMHLGGGPYPKREELYDEIFRERDERRGNG